MAPSIGMIFNCEIRNNGTAGYFHRAAKMLEADGACTVRHYMPRGEAGKHDWYLYIDDGRDDLRWNPPHPCAYYAIDTHLGYAYRCWKARHYDRVFTAQKDAPEKLMADGVPNVEWLPLACHPEAHLTRDELITRGYEPARLDKQLDITFVGYMNDGENGAGNNRMAYLDRIYQEFPNGMWVSTNVFFEEMSLRYVRSRIGFNVSIKHDLNMRVFEIMSTGTPLLTNSDASGLDDLFKDNVHYIPYVGIDHAVKQAAEWLSRPQELAEIGRRGFEEVRSKHTYKHRMQHIIEVMNHA